jgi:hypothetical protein
VKAKITGRLAVWQKIFDSNLFFSFWILQL